MRRLLAWTSGIAFVGGVVGPDAIGVLVTGFAAFVSAYGFRRAPWRWAILAITGWGLGAALGAVLNLLGGGLSAPPSQAGAGVTVVMAYASAFAGASMKWVTLRLARHP